MPYAAEHAESAAPSLMRCNNACDVDILRRRSTKNASGVSVTNVDVKINIHTLTLISEWKARYFFLVACVCYDCEKTVNGFVVKLSQ